MPQIIALVDDLLFLSRIREAALRAGSDVVQARDPAALLAAARSARLVLVDADSDRTAWPQAIAALRADPALAEIPVVAFLSHVAAERANRARAAGIRRVLSRAAFVRELPGLLSTAAPARSEEKTP